jgi:hypothetical protein
MHPPQQLEVNSVLLSGAQNANVAGVVNINGVARDLKVFITWPADSSAGAVTIEEAYVVPGPDSTVAAYSGAWSPIGSPDTSPSSASAQHVIAVGPGVFSAVRARVSTTVNGSTGVTVRIIGN